MADLIDSHGNPLNSPGPKAGWWKRFALWFNKNLKVIVGLVTIFGGVIVILNFFGIRDSTNLVDSLKQKKNCFTQNSGYKVLLLPFQPLESCKIQDTYLERTIQTRLSEMSEEYKLGLQVCLDTVQSCPSNYEDARAIGDKQGADLVIWGDLYERCNINSQACLKYVVVNKALHGIENKGKSDVEAILELSDVMEGQLQRDVDYIIYWTLAFEASSQGECDKAGIYYKNAVHKFPEKASESYYNLAHCYYDINSFKLSIDYYDRVIELNPKHIVSYNNRGLAKIRLDDYAGAISDGIQAIRINPEYAVGYSTIGTAISGMGNHIQAVSYFDEAIAIDPQHTSFYYNRALAKFYLNSFKDAVADFSKAIELDAGYAPSYYGRGVAKVNLGNTKSAITDFAEAVNINLKYADAYGFRGVERYKLKDYKGAISDLTRALEFKPKDASSYFNRGIIKTDLGDFEGAITDFSKVIQLDSEYARSYHHRGLARLRSGDFKNAAIDFTKAIQLNPDFTEAIEAKESLEQEAAKTKEQKLFRH